MPIVTIDGHSSDGWIQSRHATYATARASGTLTAVQDTNLIVSNHSDASAYRCDESFIAFDTSVLPDAAIINSVTLRLYLLQLYNAAGWDPVTAEARIFDWGTSLTTADRVQGANLAALPLAATLSATALSPGYYDFTEVGGVLSANINTTGFTRLILNHDHHRLGIQPPSFSNGSYFNFRPVGTFNQYPQLVIDYTGDPIHIPSSRITQQHVVPLSRLDVHLRTTQQHVVPILGLSEDAVRLAQQHLVVIAFEVPDLRVSQQHVVAIAQDPVTPPIPPIDDDKIPPISPEPPGVIERKFRFPYHEPWTR